MLGCQVHQTLESLWILHLSKCYKPSQQHACLLIWELKENAFCLSDFIKCLEYPAGKLLLYHLLSCRWRIGISWTWPFCELWSLSWKEQILCFNAVVSIDSCLTGWFAVNAQFLDYCLPKAILATSQMFLIQGFEANPSYTLWIWFFLPTWEAMQTGYFSCFGDKSKIREDLQFFSSCLCRSILQEFSHSSDSHCPHPECGPHSKALKVKGTDRRETRWKNNLFMLLPSCVRMGTHGAYTVWLAPGSWPCVIQVTRCSNHSATDAVSPSPRKYLISCTMQKQLPKENSSAKQPSTSC